MCLLMVLALKLCSLARRPERDCNSELTMTRFVIKYIWKVYQHSGTVIIAA